MSNRFCPNCGKPVLDKDLFCGACGTALKSDKSGPVTSDGKKSPVKSLKSVQILKYLKLPKFDWQIPKSVKPLFTTRPKLKTVIIGIVALVLIIGLPALYLVLKDGSKPGLVTALAFHPDGTVLASGGADHRIRFYDIQTGKEISSISDSFATYAIAFSPDGNQLAVGRYDVIRVYTYTGHKLLHELKGHSTPVIALMFSPNNKRLYSIDESRSLKVWDMDTGKYLGGTKGKKDRIASAALSPDVKYYAYSPYLNKRIYVIRTSNGSRVRSIRLPDASSEALTFYPKGPLVGGVDNKTARFWSVESGYRKGHIEFCCYGIQSLAVDLKGTRVAAGLLDGKIEIRAAKDGKVQATLFHYSFLTKIFHGNAN